MTRAWPWERERSNPAAIARRVAGAYRTLAEKLSAELGADEDLATLDAQMLEYGQRWVIPVVVPYQPDDLLPADLAADYFAVSVKTVYKFRANGLRSVTTPDGIRFRYSDLLQWRS